MLWRDALVLYDRDSRSLWSQIDGVAKAGPRSGERMAKIPSQITTWADWRSRHPRTLVLVKPPLERSPYASYHERASWVGVPMAGPSDDDRLRRKTLVLGVEVGEATVAIRPETLERSVFLQRHLRGVPLLVVASDGVRSGLVFERRVDGRELHFVSDPSTGHLIDEFTGTVWDKARGVAIEGPLAGRRLRRIVATPIYWAPWSAFHPGSLIW